MSKEEDKRQGERRGNIRAAHTPLDISILVVDDDLNFLRSTKLNFSAYDNESDRKPIKHWITCVQDAETALKQLSTQNYDVTLIDLNLPGEIDGKKTDGKWLLYKIKEGRFETCPIIVSGTEDMGEVRECRILGARDYIVKGAFRQGSNFKSLFICSSIDSALEDYVEVRSAYEDHLTKIKNRRYFDVELEREFTRANRSLAKYERSEIKNADFVEPLSLLLFDVDNFKKYNDTYGHVEGDDVLRTIGEAVKRRVRKSIDIVSRFGGEEFAIIFPNTGFQDALNLSGEIRKMIQNIPFNPKNDEIVNVTISGGIATYPTKQNFDEFNELKRKIESIGLGELIKPNSIIYSADQGLYKAKESGKNQIWNENLLDEYYKNLVGNGD